ncbi:MAG: hypothetical protein DMG93_15655 [Acidobacteria bacterium]|nr:MAG: hypothetical protein DMG93_15655 [Acidobacteriota bacterium]
MSRLYRIVLLLTLCSAALTLANAQKPSKPAVKKPQKQVVQQQTPPPTPAQAQPEPPATPEHGPSSPPDVTFKGGQLTITARNSTLGDVLNAVKQKTGAAVDMPASSSERVVGQFGPGAPRDVMAQLLNGSHRASGPEPAPAPQQNQPSAAGFQPGLQVVPQVPTDQAEDNAGEMPAEMQQAPEEEQQQEQPEQVEQPDQPSPSGQGTPTVKTPEELLRELQQQQQQQQQQQNGQQPPQ